MDAVQIIKEGVEIAKEKNEENNIETKSKGIGDSVKCTNCGQREDKRHVDFTNGKGTFDKVRKKEQESQSSGRQKNNK